MKALVTGGTGFIGSHLVEALLQRGIQVRCLLRKASDMRWLEGLPIEVTFGDCNDQTSLKEAVKGVDQIFHLAGITKAIHEKTYFEVNARGTENMIHACLENNPHLQKFIYLSSQAAAGPCRNGNKRRESDPCEPVAAYGQSKRMGEELALSHAHEIPLLILRPCAVYGPRERDIYIFFKLLSKRIKLCLSGEDQHLSLCYVEDIIQAILLSAQSQEPSGEIFFLSDGQDYQLEEISDTLTRRTSAASTLIGCGRKAQTSTAASISSASPNPIQCLRFIRPLAIVPTLCLFSQSRDFSTATRSSRST